MKIVWDEAKRQSNLAKHGIDFADVASRFDFGRAIRFPVRPSATGRARVALVGSLVGPPERRVRRADRRFTVGT